MKIKAVRATEENFKPYGRVFQIQKGPGRTGTGGWHAWMSPEDILDDVANFGITRVTGGDFAVDSMESHPRTQEALFPGNGPIVLAVADTDPSSKGAKPEDIRAFIIEPGCAVVLDRGIWHDACRHAGEGECFYYFLAHSLDPAVFIPVDGEPVQVEVR